MNVLVIPEDFRNDQHIVQPIVRKLFEQIGKPRAKVKICIDPLLGGSGEALKWSRIADVIDMYPMVNIFILVVHRDGDEHRRSALDNLEQKATEVLPDHRFFFAENAWQEVEVWALAGLKLPKTWKWNDVRAEVNPKERYFEIIAKERGLLNEPGKGRTTLGREAAAN